MTLSALAFSKSKIFSLLLLELDILSGYKTAPALSLKQRNVLRRETETSHRSEHHSFCIPGWSQDTWAIQQRRAGVEL